MFNNHLMKACLAAVFAIGLAACSSSDNGTDSSQTPTDPPPTATEQELDDLKDEIAALRAQLGLDADDDIGDSITALMDERDRLQQQVDDAAEAEAEAMREAMVAAAAKLYAGISVPTGDVTSPAATDRAAAYNDDDDAILVSAGQPADTPAAATLSEDEDTMVADNAGWEGKRYTRTMPAAGGMYEAVVYSDVGEPTTGAKFNSGTTGDDVVGFDTTDGVLTFADATNVAVRIASPSFDHNAGYKTFELPDPNPNSQQVITISGSYYGVAGTYGCNPTVDADGCRVNRAANGYTLALTGDGGGAWTFTATDPEQRVTEAPDMAYASYGWWIHRAANDGDFTASVFVDEVGAAETASGIDTLMGTATYTGGAAGHYALRSSTGGTNDGGQFTADATLEANFNNDTITGTIDGFMGADGEARDWSVELAASSVSATGAIAGDPDTTGNTDAQMTVWTIGGTDGDAAGQWSGDLWNNGDDGVPQAGTGTFYSEFGEAGKMVGAFGVNLQ